MALSKVTYPEVFGPGYWAFFHTEAKRCKTYARKMEFIRNMKGRLAGLPCLKCRIHALEYLATHPIENWIGEEDGIFLWTFHFHNYVNTVQCGKREVTLEEANSIWEKVAADAQEILELSELDQDFEDCHGCSVPEPAPGLRIIPARKNQL